MIFWNPLIAADLESTAAVPDVVFMSYLDVLAPYFGVFFVAWMVTILVTPVMRFVAIRFNLVDWPDLNRKNHLEPVAYLGGVAIFLGWLAGVVVCWFVSPHTSRHAAFTQMQFPWSIIAGATIIMIIGLVDDIKGIRPRIKVGWQLIAAGLLAYNDMGIKLMQDVLGIMTIPDPVLVTFFPEITLSYILGSAVMAVFVIGACNAVNLLDGLDGLVAGSLSITYIGFLIIACYVAVELTNSVTEASTEDVLSDQVRIVMCMAVLGALLGFLPHNFNPANIFMGDAGSLLLGYLSATTILLFAHAMKMGPLLVTAALIVFALPITDAALAIFRRVMLRKGVKLAVICMYILSTLFAVLGCALVFLRWRIGLAVFVVIFGFVMVIGYKAGHRRVFLSQADESAADPAANPESTKTKPEADPPHKSHATST